MTLIRRPLLPLLLALGVASTATAEQVVAKTNIPVDGSIVSLPRISDPGEYRLRISGVFHCDIDGRAYDAEYRTDADGDFRQPHKLLRINPPALTLRNEDIPQHMYTYAPDDMEQIEDRSVTVHVNTNKLLHEFVCTPSRLRESLSGGLKAELVRVPSGLTSTALVAGIVVPVVLVAMVLALTIRAAQRAATQPYQDVHAMRRRIDRKSKEALQELDAGNGLFQEIRQRIRQLRASADELSEHVITFRQASEGIAEREIENDLEQLRQDMADEESDDVVAQYQQQIENKQRTLEYLRTNSERESNYLLRLSRAETTIDNLRLRLPQMQVDLDETGIDEQAVQQIESDLEALQQALNEVKTQQVPEELR